MPSDSGPKRKSNGAAFPRYFPRKIVVSPEGKFTSEKLHEVLVVGNDGVGALAKITTILSERRVNIIPSGGFSLWKPGKFIWTAFADFARSKAAPVEVLAAIKRLGFVDSAKLEPVDNVNFDRYLFPVYLNNGFRGIILSLEPLMGVERRLVELFGSPGEAIMFEEGKNYAVQSMRQLGGASPGGSADGSEDILVAWLRTTGWGLFEFDNSTLSGQGQVGVSIREPPMAGIPGLEGSNFLNGVTAGLVEALYGKPVKLESSSYDSAEKVVSLLFSSR